MLKPDDARQEGADQPPLGQVYNPLEGPQLENPYPVYARARREEPVFFSEMLQSWVITRYDDIRSVLSQPDLFSSKDTLRPTIEWVPEVFQILGPANALFVPIIINTDGKEHQRFRAPLNHAFLPVRMRALESEIRAVTNRLIDAFYEDGHTDLMATFAGPLPQEIILRVFGIPQADMARCKRWSDDYLSLIYASLPPERQIEGARSVAAFQAYLADLVEQQREKPGENVVGSLLTVHADSERPLSKIEIVAMLSGVLMAGHETTTNLIGTAVYLLLSQPERWQYICDHPEAIPAAIEETLRFEATTQAFYRTALRETQVGGVTIPEGGLMMLVYGSGNHDETRFERAEEFDLHRSSNQHFGFGYGVHFCAGAPLARLEGRIALETLSQRLDQLHLQPQRISYTPNVLGRLLQHLEVEWRV